MIRNLLYSLSLHLFVLLLFYSNSILYKPKNTLDLSKDIINVKNSFLDKIKNKSKSKINTQLTLQEKIDLFNFVENGKKTNVKYAKLKDIEKQISNTKVKNIINNEFKKEEKVISSSNALTLNSRKVYVNEKKITKEQKEKINKQNKIKKEIREKKADKLQKLETRENFEKPAENEIDSLLKDLDNNSIVVEKENSNIQTTGEDINVSEIDQLMDILDIPNLDSDPTAKLSEAEILNLSIDNIFNKDDYEKLQKMQNNDKKNSVFDLTIREKINIQKQIRVCYKNAILQNKKNSPILMSVEIAIAKNGRIDMNNVIFNIVSEKDLKNLNKNDYNITVKNIKLALINCNPLRNLPYSKYTTWKNMILMFNNN